MKFTRKTNQEQRESSSLSPPPSPSVVRPPLEWDHPSQCLGPILRHNSLPLVVTCDKSGLPPMEQVNFDFTQPLFLHTRRTVRKVIATNVLHVVQNGNSHLKEFGDHLLIPEDYKGWFAVLGSPEEVNQEKVVPHFRQVAQLALSNCETFLIGGKNPVSAVQIPTSAAQGENRAQPRLVYPGDILRMGKLYVGESTIKVKRLFGGKKLVKKEDKFLLCTDEHDRELYLPVESRGTFYMLTTEGRGTPKIPIMRMPDICTHFRFPCVVKLLFGRVPSTPCSFTGTLMLLDSQMESSVIGCTMTNIRNILLDIPIDSDLRFLVARQTMELLSSRCYKTAKALCNEKASTYMRNMKVAYYIPGNEDLSSLQETEPKTRADRTLASPQEESPIFVSGASVHQRPRIVEEQELFCPVECHEEEATKSPKSNEGKKNRKCFMSRQWSSTEEPKPASARKDSATVLKEDISFSLPAEREILPLKPASSSPALKRGSSPQVSGLQLPAGIAIARTTGNYIRMDSPVEPARAIAHSASDAILYMQVWNGESVTSPTRQLSLDLENKPSFPRETIHEFLGSPSSPCRPSEKQPAPKRFSSIALANNYLSFPVYKATSEAGLPSRTASESSGMSSSHADLASNGNHLYQNGSGNHSASPKVNCPLPPSASDHSYKNLPRTPNSYDVCPDLPEKVPPRPFREGKLKSPSPEPLKPSLGKSKPPPPPPPVKPRKLTPPIKFENPRTASTSSSTLSSEHSSPWQPRVRVDAEKSGVFNARNGSGQTPHRGVRAGQEPVYIRMQPGGGFNFCQVDEQILAEEEDFASLDVGAEEADEPAAATSFSQSESGSEEIVYENIANLRLVKERGCSFELVSSVSSGNRLQGGFLDKLVNNATMFGYQSPPPPRPTSNRKPPLSRKPALELNSPDDAVYPKVPFETTSNGPSTPFGYCPVRCEPPFASYLHPCGSKRVKDAKFPCQTCSDDKSLHSGKLSRLGSEDDLPLGASFDNFRPPMSDSGCAIESFTESELADSLESNELSSLSVADLGDALRKVGLAKDTVETLRREKVDGRLLASLDEELLKETLPDVKKLDVKKILMFKNGWRPVE